MPTLQVAFLLLKFIGTVFVDSIILMHVITESSIILRNYSLFSQANALWFQTIFFTYTTFYWIFGFASTFIFIPFFDINFIFYHQIYIYKHMKYVLLIFWFIHQRDEWKTTSVMLKTRKVYILFHLEQMLYLRNH